MNNLEVKINGILEFLKAYPNLVEGATLKKAFLNLEKAVDKALPLIEEAKLEELPNYSEVASLLEGEGKTIATKDFMEGFSFKIAGKRLDIPKSDKASRKRFLKLVAKSAKLGELRDRLDPNKFYRGLFDELIRHKLSEIEIKLSSMRAKELTGLVEANGLKAPRTKTGKVSKSKKTLKTILSQIEKIKLLEHF